MQANLLELYTWASAQALGMSEPVVLLVLGGLFLVLSLARTRINHVAAPDASIKPAESAAPRPRAGSVLAAQQGR